MNKTVFKYEMPIAFPTFSGFLELEDAITSGITIDTIGFVSEYIPTRIQIIRTIGKLKLYIPLIVTVTEEDEWIFVENDWLNIWAEGNSLKEALDNFEDFFMYDYETYDSTLEEKMDFFARQKYQIYKWLLNKS